MTEYEFEQHELEGNGGGGGVQRQQQFLSLDQQLSSPQEDEMTRAHASLVGALIDNGVMGKLRAQLRYSMIGVLQNNHNIDNILQGGKYKKGLLGSAAVLPTKMSLTQRLGLLLCSEFLASLHLELSHGILEEECSMDVVLGGLDRLGVAATNTAGKENQQEYQGERSGLIKRVATQLNISTANTDNKTSLLETLVEHALSEAGADCKYEDGSIDKNLASPLLVSSKQFYKQQLQPVRQDSPSTFVAAPLPTVIADTSTSVTATTQHNTEADAADDDIIRQVYKQNKADAHPDGSSFTSTEYSEHEYNSNEDNAVDEVIQMGGIATTANNNNSTASAAASSTTITSAKDIISYNNSSTTSSSSGLPTVNTTNTSAVALTFPEPKSTSPPAVMSDEKLVEEEVYEEEFDEEEPVDDDDAF